MMLLQEYEFNLFLFGWRKIKNLNYALDEISVQVIPFPASDSKDYIVDTYPAIRSNFGNRDKLLKRTFSLQDHIEYLTNEAKNDKRN